MRGEYVESQDYRFKVSDDAFSQQRYQAILDTFETVKEMPAFGGLVLSGSLSKGRVLDEESAKVVDIDLTAFIDWNECQQRGLNYDILDIHLRQSIVDMIAMSMARQNGDVLSLSFPSRRVFVDLEIHTIASSGRFSILRQLEQIKRQFGLYPGSIDERFRSFQLSSYFGMDVRDCLQSYHKAFFEQIGEREDAEELWRCVYGSIVRTERGGSIPEQIKDQFPHTLELARVMYL